MNNATVACIAKKLRAREWSKALGQKSKDHYLDAWVRQMTDYALRQKQEEQRIQIELKETQRRKQKAARVFNSISYKLHEALCFGSKTNGRIRQVLEELGRVFEITFLKNSELTILVETWEEARARNIYRKGRPPIILYMLKAKSAKGRFKLISVGIEVKEAPGALVE